MKKIKKNKKIKIIQLIMKVNHRKIKMKKMKQIIIIKITIKRKKEMVRQIYLLYKNFFLKIIIIIKLILI